MSNITKLEMKYVFGAIGFSLVWFLLIIPYLLGRGIEEVNPYVQFLIFNIGIFVFLQIFLKARTLKRGIDIKNTLGIISLVISLDIILPPFLLTRSGELLNAAVLKGSASDYIFGYFAINTLGLSGILAFMFTYILVPGILLFIAAKLLSNMVRQV